MFDIDRWQEIFSAIKKNKLRSIMTGFGVFWAIFMLVIMAGAGNGLNNGITNGMKDFATNSGFVWSQQTTKSFEGYKRGRHWSINNNDIVEIRDQVQGLDVISPRLMGSNRGGENVLRGDKSAAFTVMGDYPQYRRIDPCTMLWGRYINDEDIAKKRKVCIIGEKVYETMFKKDEDPVGQQMRVNGVYFMVVGVFSSNNPNINIGGNKKETIYLPFTSMQQTFNYGDEVHYFGITAKAGFKIKDIVDEIKPVLQKNHKIAPNDKEAVANVDIESEVKTFNNINVGISSIILFVGIFTLIAGAIGISNIMLVIVKERTKEIGIQRAIGARPWIIVSQILTESVFLTTIAGFLGLAFGTMILSSVDALIDNSLKTANPNDPVFFMNPEIGLTLALSALSLLVVVGLIAGLLPALNAIKIKPIEALRHE